jgi:hypothetical protein
MSTKTLSLLSAGLLCLSAGVAAAQSSNEQKPGQMQRQLPGVSSTESGASSPQPGDLRSRLAFAPDQRRMIRAYVVERNVAPVVVQQRLVVGQPLPADVELMAVPSEWGTNVAGYRYVYAGNQIYFVEPSSRVIVQTLD